MEAASVSVARKRRSRFLRFSLRTLLLFALTAGAAGLLARNWKPWVLENVLTDTWPLWNPGPNADIAVRGEEKKTEVWNLRLNRHICSFVGSPYQYFPPVCSPVAYDNWVAGTTSGGAVEIVRTDTGERVSRLNGATSVFSWWAFSPNGRRILAWTEAGKLGVFDVGTGKLMREMPAFSNDARFNHDGTQVIQWTRCRIEVTDVESGEIVFRTRCDFQMPVVSQDGRLAKVMHGGHLKVCDIQRGTIKTIEACDRFGWGDYLHGYEVQFLKNANTMLVPLRTATVLVDIERDEVKHEFEGKFDYFDKDGRIRTESSDKDTLVWDADTGALVSRKGKRWLDEEITSEFPMTLSRSRRVELDANGVVWIHDARSGVKLYELGKAPNSGQYCTTHSPHYNRFYPESGRLLIAWCPQRTGSDDWGCIFQHSYSIFRNRRPEQWWGLAWLPEFWAAVTLTCGFFWSLISDWRVKQ